MDGVIKRRRWWWRGVRKQRKGRLDCRQRPQLSHLPRYISKETPSSLCVCGVCVCVCVCHDVFKADVCYEVECGRNWFLSFFFFFTSIDEEVIRGKGVMNMVIWTLPPQAHSHSSTNASVLTDTQWHFEFPLANIRSVDPPRYEGGISVRNQWS